MAVMNKGSREDQRAGHVYVRGGIISSAPAADRYQEQIDEGLAIISEGLLLVDEEGYTAWIIMYVEFLNVE